MTTSSASYEPGSLPQIAIVWNLTKNLFQFGSSSSSGETDRVFTICLQMTIPVWSLNKHLPKNLILTKAQVNLLLDNEEFCRAEWSLEGDLPRLDFRTRFRCGGVERFLDLLMMLTAKVNLLTAEGMVAVVGDISLDVFSANEISSGRVKMILTRFRYTVGSATACPIDMSVSIDSGAAGLEGTEVPRTTEISQTAAVAPQFPVAIMEPRCVKTGAEDENLRNTAVDTISPLDLSLPKDIKPDVSLPCKSVAIQERRSTSCFGTAGNFADTQRSHHKDIKPDAPSLPLPCNNVPMQSGGSTLDYKASTQSRTASTEANISSSAINETDTHEINYLLGVTERLKKQFKMRRYATSRINPRFRDGPYRPAPLSAIELEVRKLSNSIAQLENKRKK